MGEWRLLLLKLFLRPQLHHRILHIVGKASGTWEQGVSSIAEVHAHHAAGAMVVEQVDSDSNSGKQLKLLAVMFLCELVRWDKLHEDDLSAHRQSNRHALPQSSPSSASVSSSAASSVKVTPDLTSIRRCAPQCMTNALASATGLTHDQASMPSRHRDHLSMFLLKCGVGIDGTTRTMRPHVLVEYELEKPKQTWQIIQHEIKVAADTLQRSKGKYGMLQRDAHHATLTCATIMDSGMCPFRAAPSANYHMLTPDQRKEQNKQDYVMAKRQCHAQFSRAIPAPVGPLNKKRKLSSSASVGGGAVVIRVPSEWASGPYEFAQQMRRLYREGNRCSSFSW
jgi:hypothetical protein